MNAVHIVKAALLAVLLGVAGMTAASGDEPVKICGGIQGLTCPASDFCEFSNNSCGAGDQTGFCMPKPEFCTREYVPVCGCDGKTYPNDCERRAAGAAKQKDGAC